MIQKTLLIILCSLLLVCCKSTIENNASIEKEVNYIPYYLKVYEADSLFLTNNFDRSYKILDSLFKVYKPIETDNYAEYSTYLSSAVQSGNLTDIEDKVKFGLLHFGGITSLHPQYYEIREALIKASGLSEIEIKDLKNTYYNNLNLELRKKLLTIFESDQAVRQNGGSFHEMDSIDSRNNKELVTIFETYGYPSKDLIGSASAYDIPGGDIRLSIVLVHQPDSFWIKYLPVMLEHLKKGNCDPSTYAYAYDRMMFQNQSKQYFGTYICGSTDDICPLINAPKIDSIRKSIGLPHIKYYSWKVEQLSRQ